MSASDSSTLLSQLLDRARNGDDQARDQLFEKCRNYVRIVAHSQAEGWLRTKVDASDLVQQTLLEAHRGFENFRGNSEAEWLGWLKRILANNVTDFIRHYQGTAKRKAEREVPLFQNSPGDSAEYSRNIADQQESPSQFVLRREREVEVADAITRLSTDHQEIIMLRNLQRLPFDEISKRMNRTRPAVQMLWMRALNKLKQELSADENGNS